MLEMELGNKLLNKLRAILLMEVETDFNFGNKQTYGIQMLDNARKYGLMADEIFSERNRMADDGTLSRVLFFDLIRQTRKPAGMSSVDAANCYDRIAHAIASLTFQAFGVKRKTSVPMLKAIEEMKLFLRTAYGDSKDFAGSSIGIKPRAFVKETAPRQRVARSSRSRS